MSQESLYGYGASGIDPLTGLPIEPVDPTNPGAFQEEKPKPVDPFDGMVNPVTGLPLSDYEKRNYSSIRKSAEAGPTLDFKGHYQVDLDAYEDYMTQVKPWVGQTELDRRRAVGQSGWEQAGHAALRTVAGAALDFVGGMASMIDIEDYYNQDDEIGNPVTNKMEELKQQLNEALPIYRENPNEAFDVGDPGWWYENGSSLLSSIGAFAAQGAVVGATFGAGAAGLTANAAKWAQKLARGGANLATAAGLNQTEAVMEAGSVYRDNMDFYLKSGATEEQAKAKAANDAANVININRANILLNLTSASMFTRMGTQLATRTALKEPVKMFSREGLRTLGAEGAQEFAEEQINYIGSEEGKAARFGYSNENILEALTDGKSMAKYADDPHFWESGVLGAVGGLGQGSAGFAYRKASGKYKQELDAYLKQEQRISELNKMADKTDKKSGNISDVFLKAQELQDYYEKQKKAEIAFDAAKIEGDPEKLKAAQQELQIAAQNTLWKQTTMSFEDGTTENLINAFKNFENLSEEDAKKKGLPSNYRERAKDAVTFIEEAEKAYNEMEFKPRETRIKAVSNRAAAHIQRSAIKEKKQELADITKEMNSIREGLSEKDAALSDEALSDKNDLFKDLLKRKRKIENTLDNFSEGLNELDSEYSSFLKSKIGKRAAKRLSRSEIIEERSKDSFRESLQDRILEGKLNRLSLETVKDDLRRSNHPQKEARMQIVDELIQNLRDAEQVAFDKKVSESRMELLSDIENMADNLKEELGMSDKAAKKAAEAASKKVTKTPSDENVDAAKEEDAAIQEQLDEEQMSIESLVSSFGNVDPLTGQPIDNTDVPMDGKPVKNDTYDNLSEERKNDIDGSVAELALKANSTKELNTALDLIASDEEAVTAEELQLIKDRKAELEEIERQLKEQKELQEEAKQAGIDPELLLSVEQAKVSLANEAIDNTIENGENADDYSPFDDFVEVDDIEIMEDEAANKNQSQRTKVPDDAVSTIDTQFITVKIQEPKTESLLDIEEGMREKGFYIKAVDENGNPLRQPATKYRMKSVSKLTEEEAARAIPVFWYPLRIDEKTGQPILKKGKGMERFVYNKSGKPVPVKTNGLVGQELYMVPDEGPVLYQDEVIKFEDWVNPELAPEGGVVYLKKGQYVYPGGPKKGQTIYEGKDYTDEVITVHLTPDGPPVQKIAAGDTDLRRNFTTYADESGAVPVRLHKKERGFIINQKLPDGSSAKNPVTVLGKMGEDYYLGYSKNKTVHYYDGKTWREMDANSEDGRVYAMVKSANGEVVPVRLETKNISEKDANSIIDNILLDSSKDGANKKLLLSYFVPQNTTHRVSDGENPKGPIFVVDNTSIKLRVGNMIVAIDHINSIVTTNDGKTVVYNNLQQALEGKPFQVRVCESSVSSPNFEYGAIRTDKEGKPIKEILDVSKPGRVSPEVHEALKDFRATLLKAITEKKYQVSKTFLEENGFMQDVLDGGTEYETYLEYLEAKNILTTDTQGLSNGQKFTNAKGHLIPVNKKITLVRDTAKPAATDSKPKGTINVYWRQSESESSTRILSNLAPRRFMWEGREYGSVEHAYQSNKSGTFDQVTYDAYNNLKEIPGQQGPGYGKKIRGKGSIAEMKAADSLGLMKKLVVESFKQNSNSEAAKKLLQYENFTHNTNQLIDQAFLEGLKLAQKELLDNQTDEITSENVEVVSDTDTVITGDTTTEEIETPGTEDLGEYEDIGEIDPDDIDLDTDFFARKVEKEYEKDPLSILTDTELQWILDTFGEEHLLPMAQAKKIMINGEEVYGAYSNGLIALARLGAKGTGYHEAYHLVMDLAVSPESKQKILAAAQARYGTFLDGSEEHEILKKRYPKKTRAELEEVWLEEQLAEEFRRFMEAEESEGRIKKTKLGKIIQNLFDRIRKAILAMRIAGTKLINPDSIYLSPMLMKKQFLSIKMGELKADSRTKASLSKENFNLNNAKFRAKKGWTEDEKQDMINSMRYALLQKVLPDILANPDKNTTGAASVSDILTNNKHRELLVKGISEVREVLRKAANTHKAKFTETGLDAYKTGIIYIEKAISDEGWLDFKVGGIVENPGFESLLLSSLKVHGTNIKIKRDTQDISIENETKGEASIKENESLEFGEVVLEEESSNDGETSKERIHDLHFSLSDPKKSLSKEIKTALSFIPTPTIIDAKTGKKISTGRSKYTMLPTFIDFHKVYSLIVSKLADTPVETMEEKMEELAIWNPEINAVYTEFQNWSPELKNTFKANMSKTQLKFITAIAGENEEWGLIETNRSGILKQILEDWSRNKYEKGLFTRVSGETDTVNKDVLTKLGTAYRTLFNENLQKNPEDYYNAVNDVFSYVGIEFDREALKMLASKYKVEDFHKNYVENKFEYILKDLGYDPKTELVKDGKGSDPYISTDGKGQLKTITKIAELVKDIKPDLYTGTFVNGEGKMVYSINLNSYISKFRTNVSTAQGVQKLWDTFSKDVYYNPDGNMEIYSSIFLSLMKDNSKVREEFDIIELDTVKEAKKEDGVAFDAMTEKQGWLTRLSMFSNNGNSKATGFSFISMGTKSDKGRSLYMKVPILQHPNSPKELRRGLENDIKGIKAAAKQVLKRNVMQEYARIKKTQEQLFGEKALKDSDLVENIHYKGENLDRTQANGLKFMSIPDLNFDTYKLFNDKGVVDFSTKTAQQAIDKALDAFIEREVLRGKRRMESAGVLFEKDGVFYSDVISQGSFKGTKEKIDGEEVVNVDEGVSEFLINEIVWRTEMNKFQMGDLAFYKTKTADISNDPDFNNVKGIFQSVVTDAGKRAYQSVTPGIDHVIDSIYGKPETMSMAIVKDIFSDFSLNSAGEMAYNLAKNKENFRYKEYLQDTSKDISDLTLDQQEAIKIARNYLEGSNVADGQGYTTLEAHRHSMMSRGDWTMGEGETHERAYNEYWTTEPDYNKWPDWAKALALKPLKSFHWGYQYDSTTKMMVFKQIKHSTTPLYPAMTKGVPSLEKLRQRMEAIGEFANMPKIDVVNMESAVKVGKSGATAYSNDSSYLSNLTIQTLYSDNERNPFILPTDKGTDPKDGSQFVKLITGDMPVGAVYTTVEGIDAITSEQLKDVTNKVYAEKIRRAAEKLKKDLGYENYNKNDRASQLNFLKKVQSLLLEQIEARDLPDNYSIALEIQQLENGDYTFAMPLSFPAYAKKFEIALASLYKSRVMTQRLPGDSAVQVAEYGLDQNRLKYIAFENGKAKAAECAISYKQAEKLGISKYVDEKGEIDYKAMKRDGIDKSVLEIIGYRIPTQGKSSMIPLIVKRILPPTAKGQIMLPKEITKQTGSDYDVDKMFLYYPGIEKVEKNGKEIIRKKPFTKSLQGLVEGSKDPKTLTDTEIQNILFATRFGILTSEHNAKDVVNPLDSDTYKVKLKEYDKKGLLEKTSTFNFASGYTDLHLEMVNKDAKRLVGIFSLHSVAHALSQDVDITTSTPVFIETTDYSTLDENGKPVIVGSHGNPANNLSGQIGFNGVLRSIYINENQNAALDNAKEPITGSLNINTLTSNLISYLNRLGYNNSITTDFVNQPIIRALAKEKAISGDIFVGPVAERISDIYNLPTEGRDGKTLEFGASAANRVPITEKNLKEMLGKSLEDMTEEELRHQKQVLIDFVEYHKAGSDLAKANKMMSPDRFDTMSGLVDIEIWKDNKEYVESEKSVIQINNLYTEDSAIPRVKAYYDYYIEGAEKLISEFMPYNSVVFNQAKKDIALITHRTSGTVTDSNLLNKLNEAIYSYILFGKQSPISLLFTETSKDVLKKRLFDKENSIARDLEKIKKTYKLSDNIFLNMLKADSFNSRNTLQMIKFNNAASYSAETKSSFTDAFEELLRVDGIRKAIKVKYEKGKYRPITADEKEKAVKTVQTVMNRIVQYGIVTSAFQGGPNSFIDIFPISLWKNLFLDTEGQSVASLSKYLYDQKANFDSIIDDTLGQYRLDEEQPINPELGIPGHSNMVDQIVRNLFTYPKLLKSVSLVGNKLEVLVQAKGKTSEFPGKFRIQSENAGNIFTKSSKRAPVTGFPSYVKMWDRNNKKWRLYALQDNYTRDRYGWAEYQVISPLGEANKFFEVYPEDSNPTSIHPDNNDFKMIVESKAKPVEEQMQEDQASFGDMLGISSVKFNDDVNPMIENEIKKSNTIDTAQLEEMSDTSSDIDLSSMSDISSVKFDFGEMDDTYKDKEDNGDINSVCEG